MGTSPLHLTATITLVLLEPRLVLKNIKGTPHKRQIDPQATFSNHKGFKLRLNWLGAPQIPMPAKGYKNATNSL